MPASVRPPARPLALAATALSATALGLVALPATTAVAGTHIGSTAGTHVSAVHHTDFTVTLKTTAYATHYRLFASTTRSNVYVGTIDAGHSHAHTVTSTKPKLTASGWSYTTAPVYYRVESYRSSTSRSWSDIFSVGLRPATPTKVALHSSSRGTYLTWSAGAATGFTVAQSTAANMQAGRVDYNTRGPLHQFTPYGLKKGTTYYFCLRANASGTKGAYTCGHRVKVANRGQNVSFMTYNLLEDKFDGTKESGNTVAPWRSRRLPKAVSLIKSAAPDVIGLEEAADWAAGARQAGSYRGARMVDAVKSALGSGYTLADTEPAPGHPGWTRTGQYLLYRSATYRAVHTAAVSCINTAYKLCHYFTLPHSTWAAFQVLQNKASGAKFLAVTPHLTAQTGSGMDARRQTQTESLIKAATSYAARYALPVVYAGDFNTDVSSQHDFDGPGRAMSATNAADAFVSAQHLYNGSYNSANQYRRTAPRSSDSIDHVYASPGVAIRDWKLVISLSHGKFVGAIASDHNPVIGDVVIPY